MEDFAEGDPVEHPEYGYGRIASVLGRQAVVDFNGAAITVSTDQLIRRGVERAKVVSHQASSPSLRIPFRRAFEAVNLGVVPPDGAALEELTIEGAATTSAIRSWLARANSDGLCKAAFGYYGAGKSHFLHLAKLTALDSGWAVAYLEFDPKAADPAKPHLVYQALMSNLELPQRAGGRGAEGFLGFIREVREHWERVRDLRLFRASPWFSRAFEVLQYYPHGEDPDYLNACAWLAGDSGALGAIRKLARDQGLRPALVPMMPRIRETAEIYCMHLSVVAEVCRVLGYGGLLLILDEAEHVRNYNVRRQDRANNFFDILARCAHRPRPDDPQPVLNDHGLSLPDFWRKGPHFGLLVGLTQGDTFSDPNMSLREACAFLFSEDDKIDLQPPKPSEYERWALALFEKFYSFYPERSELLSEAGNRNVLAVTLREEFERQPPAERSLRIWVKLACLVPSILMVRKVRDLSELVEVTRRAAVEATRGALPWEDEL
ncbi:MAG TPA: BREX system ATP-binding domain-containing protein [Candidatus Binataceae bacterium]|nr:BREX system ATP-binding domain-containing protein [Candidatus Binataceae bacterium]